jgi:hypothetical protein
MAKTQLKLRAKKTGDDDETSPPATDAVTAPAKTDAEMEVFGSQKKKHDTGRYWLQVDRQTKGSFATVEAAEAAGLAIKKKFSQVQVAIYDRQESSNRILELPAA